MKKSSYIFVFCDYVLEQLRVDFGVVPPLLEVYTEYLFRLDIRRLIRRIDLQGSSAQSRHNFRLNAYLENTVLSALLLGKNIKCLGAVAWCDDTVGDLAGDDTSSSEIARSRKGDKVTE